ncbi:unnamed protein product [Caretta caretta]
MGYRDHQLQVVELKRFIECDVTEKPIFYHTVFSNHNPLPQSSSTVTYEAQLGMYCGVRLGNETEKKKKFRKERASGASGGGQAGWGLQRAPEPGLQKRKMAQETNHSQVPMLCSTGCGFYGNPRTNGMCSICYKEHLQRQNSSNGRISPPATSVSSITESLPVQHTEGSVPETPSTLDSTSTQSTQPSPVSNQSLLTESVASSQAEITAVDKTVPETEDLQALVSESAESTSEEQDKSLDKPKQKKNRCFMCRKKVGLTGFECRCGNVYCGVHRYSDVHSCSYNYKADAAEKIRKENPVVVGEKIQKI